MRRQLADSVLPATLILLQLSWNELGCPIPVNCSEPLLFAIPRDGKRQRAYFR